MTFSKAFIIAATAFAATTNLFASGDIAVLREKSSKIDVPSAKAQPVRMPQESRGTWVDRTDLYKGKQHMTQMLDKLAAANFNTIYVAMWHKGWVAYPGSKIAAIDPDISNIDPNYIHFLIDEAHKRGITVQGWTEFGFVTYQTAKADDPSHGAILDAHPELTAIDDKGLPYEHLGEGGNDWGYFYSLCPANPASHDILISLLVEMVTMVPLDALNLDRIRFPSQNFCFCPYCKEHFKQDTGYDLTPSVLNNSYRLGVYNQWRKAQVTKFMEKLTPAIRQARPGMPITACVWYSAELDGRGQDWPTWLNNGLIDLAIPMIYWSNNDGEVSRTASLVNDVHKLALGISADHSPVYEVKRQITMARDMGFGGVTLWYLGRLEDIMSDIGNELFPEPAEPYAGRVK